MATAKPIIAANGRNFSKFVQVDGNLTRSGARSTAAVRGTRLRVPFTIGNRWQRMQELSKGRNNFSSLDDVGREQPFSSSGHEVVTEQLRSRGSLFAPFGRLFSSSRGHLRLRRTDVNGLVLSCKPGRTYKKPVYSRQATRCPPLQSQNTQRHGLNGERKTQEHQKTT